MQEFSVIFHYNKSYCFAQDCITYCPWFSIIRDFYPVFTQRYKTHNTIKQYKILSPSDIPISDNLSDTCDSDVS